MNDLDRIVSFFRFFWWEWATRRDHARRLQEISGISLPQSALQLISRFRALGTVTASEMSAYFDTDASTISRQLQPLKQFGLIAPVPDATDNRVRRYKLTDAGASLAQEMEGLLLRDWQEALSTLNAAECSTLSDLLARLQESMCHWNPSSVDLESEPPSNRRAAQ